MRCSRFVSVYFQFWQHWCIWTEFNSCQRGRERNGFVWRSEHSDPLDIFRRFIRIHERSWQTIKELGDY